MKLGLFLAIGESIADFKKKGQYDLLFSQKIVPVAKQFEHVYIFSYGDESLKPLRNVSVLPNRYRVHRYLYALLMPFFYTSIIHQLNIVRGLQLTGGIPASFAKIFFGKPLVINYGYHYAQMAQGEGKPVQGILFRIIEPLVIHFADAVIVTTEELKKYLVKKYPGKTITVIPNSVDTKLFQPLPVKKKFDVLFIGRLEKTKNLPALVEAIPLIASNTRLTFIGKGSEKTNLLLLAKKCHVSLTILDPIPHQELPKILSACRCFVLPSTIEGHPKVLLEAMSCGAAVVGSHIPSISAIINHRKNGLLCSPNPKSLAQAIKTILGDKVLTKRLGKNARLTIQKKFAQDKWLQREIELLKKTSQFYDSNH